MIDILYENKDYVICIKPSGVSSQDSKSRDMVNILTEQLNTDVYCVHRLDKEVSGLMIFAKNNSFAKEISIQIIANDFKKTYLTVIEGKLNESEGYFEDLLFKDSARGKSYVVKKERKGVKKAKLHYENLFYEQNTSLIMISLYTGRTHQIRVQFSSRGYPLIGDRKYGSRIQCKTALWSYCLSFRYGNKTVEYKLLPDTELYPWNIFKNILKTIE